VSNLPPAPSTPSQPPPWPAARPTPTRPSRWLAFASLAIALVALGVAIGAWTRPLPDNKPASAPPPPSFTNQQIADAKSIVCAAFQEAHQAVVATSARSGGSDPTAILAVATSVRQARDVGSGYLLTTLAEEPATPPDLTKSVRKLANLYQKLTIGLLAELSDSDLEPLRRDSDETTSTIQGLCK
jgi:hypothetical protein